MIESCRCEDGITPTVKTIFSSYLIKDVLDQIVIKKEKALLTWLSTNGPLPLNCLIFGAYLTGARLANTLAKTSSVTVLDRCDLVKALLDPQVSFVTSCGDLPSAGWDLIVDTTGLGGIDPQELKRFETPSIFLAEDPCSDGSDATILQTSQCYHLVSRIESPRKGVLFTGGLETKTSGTMTLLVEILRRSMQDATKLEGVLYSTASWDHFERLLFREQNYDAFMIGINRPALIISSLTLVNADEVLHSNVSTVSSKINDFSEYQP